MEFQHKELIEGLKLIFEFILCSLKNVVGASPVPPTFDEQKRFAMRNLIHCSFLKKKIQFIYLMRFTVIILSDREKNEKLKSAFSNLV